MRREVETEENEQCDSARQQALIKGLILTSPQINFIINKKH